MGQDIYRTYMGHSHISYRRVTPAAVADTLRLLGVEIVFLCVVCVANKGLCLFGVLFLLPALGHYVQALTNADAAHIVCVCVCMRVCLSRLVTCVYGVYLLMYFTSFKYMSFLRVHHGLPVAVGT